MDYYWVGIAIVQFIIFILMYIFLLTCTICFTNFFRIIIGWTRRKKEWMDAVSAKNRRILVVSFILCCPAYFMAVTTFNFAPRIYYALATRHTDLSQENINGLRLYQDMKDAAFIQTYGTPYRHIDNELYNYYRLKNGLVIATEKQDSKIIRIAIESPSNLSLKTNKEIRPGDSIEKVKQLYGNHYYTRVELGLDIIGYVDKNKTLEFWIAEDHVYSIRYDIATME